MCFFFFKQKTAYEMRISDWSSDVCSSDLFGARSTGGAVAAGAAFSLFDRLLLQGTALGWILRDAERIPELFPISPKWRFVLFGLGALQFARHPEGVIDMTNNLLLETRTAKAERAGADDAGRTGGTEGDDAVRPVADGRGRTRCCAPARE